MRFAYTPCLIATILLLSNSLNAFAHGENAPGPHGGVIRMPGSFHIEAVTRSPGELSIFLLDGHFREPTTKQSSVKVFHILDKHQEQLSCIAQGRKFLCHRPDKARIIGGIIEVEAIRLGEEGSVATFPHLF